MVIMLKTEQEIKALLSKLSKWKEEQEMKDYSKREMFYEDEGSGLRILEDVEHSGVTEWIEALGWVLSKSKSR